MLCPFFRGKIIVLKMIEEPSMDEFKQLLSEARHSAKNARLKTAAIQQAVKESRKK